MSSCHDECIVCATHKRHRLPACVAQLHKEFGRWRPHWELRARSVVIIAALFWWYGYTAGKAEAARKDAA